MLEWISQLTDDNKLKLLGLAGAIIAFLVALYQYNISQKWKRAEFLASEYKTFIGNDYVQKTFSLLDGFSLPITYQDNNGQQASIEPDIQKVKSALTNIHPANTSNRKYSNVQELSYIRLCIDKFLFKLGVFQVHVDSKLITYKMLEPYICYWMEILTNPSDDTLDNETKEIIKTYIKDNRMTTLYKFYAKFKSPIS